jgi:hypothetical protein
MIEVKEEDKFKYLTPIYVPVNMLENFMIYDKPNLEVRLIKYIDDEAQRKMISKKILSKRRNNNASPDLSNNNTVSAKSLHHQSESGCSPNTNIRNN